MKYELDGKMVIATAHKLRASVELACGLLNVGGSGPEAHRIASDDEAIAEFAEALSCAWSLAKPHQSRLYLGNLSWLRPLVQEDLRTERLEIELTPQEAQEIRLAATIAKDSVSDYIRAHLGLR